MEMKPGYNQTEVGLIPDDWKVAPLGRLVKITSGISPSLFSFSGSGIPYFKVEQLSNAEKYLDATDTPYLFERGNTVPGQSVMFAKRGAAIALNKVRILRRVSFMDTNLMALTPQEGIECEYLYYALGQIGLWRFADTTSVPQINNKHVKPLPFPLPPLCEQRAIAEALSDVDGLLGGLDRLIAKKRDLKQAAMQQLLTGQTRLPGFHGEWDDTTLGDVGQFLKGSGVTKDQTRSGSLACVRYGELYTHHDDVIRAFFSWISPEVATTAVRLRIGDILFAGSGETKEEIGKCAAFISDAEAYAGGDIVILRPREADSVFLGYFLNTVSINRQKASRGQGDAVVHISSSALAAIRCRIPKPAEQTAIAEVLTEMDLELAALEQRREKTRALKQAMMQELLTGRIRLISPIAQPAVSPASHLTDGQD